MKEAFELAWISAVRVEKRREEKRREEKRTGGKRREENRREEKREYNRIKWTDKDTRGKMKGGEMII